LFNTPLNARSVEVVGRPFVFGMAGQQPQWIGTAEGAKPRGKRQLSLQSGEQSSRIESDEKEIGALRAEVAQTAMGREPKNSLRKRVMRLVDDLTLCLESRMQPYPHRRIFRQ
jgi:hypothetical protein